ncbi:MAG: hypothetical protein CVU87_13580 [Firmicutes bacterium HGW-Firmicutes-12]|jgi:hypothetical protein|nr:MAG: hypothetical protein CVU87_13580 [Firmicutes bacterium HGW-Firmicutes-12]
MFWTIIILLVIVILVGWAIRARIHLRRRRSVQNIENTVTSPASLAMGELIAIAGGIYLSLVLLESFLDLTIPERIMILNMSLDPLALLAIVIALLQPLFIILYDKLINNI